SPTLSTPSLSLTDTTHHSLLSFVSLQKTNSEMANGNLKRINSSTFLQFTEAITTRGLPISEVRDDIDMKNVDQLPEAETEDSKELPYGMFMKNLDQLPKAEAEDSKIKMENLDQLPEVEAEDSKIKMEELPYDIYMKNLDQLPEAEAEDYKIKMEEVICEFDMENLDLLSEVEDSKIKMEEAADGDPQILNQLKEAAEARKLKEAQFRKYRSSLYSSGRELYEARRRWMAMTDKEREQEMAKRCTRCKSMGHICLECPAPVVMFKRVHFPKVYSDGTKRYRCSRCGRLGHNVLGCHGPLPRRHL
ncbi:hypothetical protein CFOL_v3_29006, partial [Cephalotus follicularis]